MKHVNRSLELVCCKKLQKNSSWPVTGFGNKGPLKVLNGTKLIVDNHGNNLDSFRISLESFRYFRCPLFHKPITGQELFLAISYSKPALVTTISTCNKINIISSNQKSMESQIYFFNYTKMKRGYKIESRDQASFCSKCTFLVICSWC